MMTGLFLFFPIFHGPLTKRFIFMIPTGGEEQPERGSAERKNNEKNDRDAAGSHDDFCPRSHPGLCR